MAPALHAMILIIVIQLVIMITSNALQTSPSAHEILANYNFPIGLLPEGVNGYELNESTGEFSAYLNQPCKFSIESYGLDYKTTITGVIGKGHLRNLKGVNVKVLVPWLDIKEVVRDGDELRFSVGVAYASFPVENFNQCPRCGCGFDCEELEIMMTHGDDINKVVLSSYAS